MEQRGMESGADRQDRRVRRLDEPKSAEEAEASDDGADGFAVPGNAGTLELSEAILLAGGKSTRMGTDKALLDIGGRPLLRHLCERIMRLGLRAIVVATGEKPEAVYSGALAGLDEFVSVRYVPDLFPGCGPLAGLHAGLSASGKDGYRFVMACDMPFVSESLFVRLAQAAAGTEGMADVVHAVGQPFHACYHTRIVPALRRRLEAGDLRVMGFLGGLNRLTIEPSPEEAAAFVNLNTPSDYAAFDAGNHFPSERGG